MEHYDPHFGLVYDPFEKAAASRSVSALALLSRAAGSDVELTLPALVEFVSNTVVGARAESATEDEDPAAPAVAGALVAALREVAHAPDAAERAVAANFIVTLRTEVLAAMLGAAEPGARRRALRDLFDTLPLNCVLPLLAAAAQSFGRPVHAPIGRLLERVVRDAGAAGSEQRVQGVRAVVSEALDTLSAGAVKTDAASFEALFEELSAGDRLDETKVDADRLVQLAVELDCIGPSIWAAIAAADADYRAVLDLLKAAPPGNEASRALVAHITSLPRLREMLAAENIDFEAVDLMLPVLGVSAAPAILDALAEATARRERRALLDRAIALGPEIAPSVTERLGDARWYVLRNLLYVLRGSGGHADSAFVARFLQHTHPAVRKEAIQLLADREQTREAALTAALRDAEPAVLQFGIAMAAEGGLPDAAATELARRIVEPSFPPELRIRSLQLLAPVRSAVPALLHFVHGGSGLFGKVRLAPPSLEMLTVLRALARYWPEHPKAARYLALARRSSDREVASAARADAHDEEVSDA